MRRRTRLQAATKFAKREQEESCSADIVFAISQKKNSYKFYEVRNEICNFSTKITFIQPLSQKLNVTLLGKVINFTTR